MSRYSEIIRLFDYRSGRYDELRWVWDDGFLELLRQVLEPSEFETGLDMATGTGAVLAAMCKSSAYAVGVDPSSGMLRKAKGKIRGSLAPSFTCAVAEVLPFRSHSFDWVTCRNGVHHFSSPADGLGEIQRVLKPDGRLLIAEPVAPDDSTKPLWKTLIALKDLGRHPEFYYTSEELVEFLRTSGFVPARTTQYEQLVSINNWLDAGRVPARTRELVWEALRGATDAERRALNIEFSDTDATLTKTTAVLLAYPS